MLDGMRRLSQGIWGRIIMGLVMGFISLSFAIWGVGNIFVGYGAGKVAQVGKIDISTDDLRRFYQVQLQNMQQQTKRPITNEQAHALGLDARALQTLISDAALDTRAKSLGLAISDAGIASKIVSEPSFQQGGKFNAAQFSQMLAANGYTEASFVREERGVYLRQEIADALTAELQPSDAALEALHRFRDETRSIDYIDLPASAAGDIANPDDATLQTWFDTRRDTFRAPEYRGIVTLAILPKDLADPSKVDDAAARRRYDEVKAQRYTTPESRHAEQVVFKDEAAAKAASDEIKAGASLADVAAKSGLTVADLGSLPKSAIFDKDVAEAIYSLAPGAVSDPVKGAFGYSLIRLIDSTPEKVKPFEEVAGELKLEIAAEAAKRQASDLRDKIEDERTSGKALEDAAATVDRKVTKLDAVDQNGFDRNGGEVQGLPDRDALLRAVFASNIGVDNDTLTTPDGGFVWFEVTLVDPARQQTLAEVKDKALAAWREDETARRLTAKADEYAKKLNDGSDFADVAKEAGIDAKTANDVKRIGTTSVSPAVVARVFGLPVGKAGSAAGDNNGRIVFKVLDSVTPPFDKDSEQNKAMAGQLAQSYAEDVLAQYMVKTQVDVGVTINQAEVRAATGLSDTSDQ